MPNNIGSCFVSLSQVGEGGGLVGGFIDDVINGERLVMDRRAKEFAYYTLRLKVLFWLNVWSINVQQAKD